jgi:8-oxo-dGTP pyrophosphatase MutT (NUDIX family)
MTQVLKSQIMLKFLDMNEFAGKKTREKVQVIVIAEGDLLLLEFNTNERRNYHGFQNITGGVDPGETFTVAALRELREETGVESDVIDLDMEYKYLDRWDHYVREKVYLCLLNKKPNVVISEEHISFKWLPIQKVHASDFLFSSNFEAFQKALEYMGKKP